MRQLIVAVAAVLARSVAPGAPVTAQEAGDTLPLAVVLGEARSANPGLIAVRLRADAAAERIPQAGAWADPQLTLGLMNRPVSGFGTDQPMTMNSLQLAQRIPWPGTRGFAKREARHLAAAGRFDAEEAELAMAARVTGVYYRIAYMDRAIAVMHQTRDLLRDFFRVSQARYAVGEGLQQDVLQAQVAIAGMTEDITVMQQDRVAMAARLNALRGVAATLPVGQLQFPSTVDSLPAVDDLLAAAAARRPALRAAAERVRAAEAGYRRARRSLFPDLMVTVGYGQRPQFDDFVTLMVGFSIPLWAGSRQLPVRREMAAQQAAAEAQAADLYNETYARLTELRAQAERARRLTALYATSILPQARATVDASFSAYRVGSLEYGTLIQNELTVNRYEVDALRLIAEYHEARAQIDALLGLTSGEDQ